MAQLMADIDAMPNGDPNKVVLKRFIGSESVQVAFDKAGRICLPDEMARAAGIKDEAVLVGLLDRFEIWNPSRYENVKAADAVLASRGFQAHGIKNMNLGKLLGAGKVLSAGASRRRIAPTGGFTCRNLCRQKIHL